MRISELRRIQCLFVMGKVREARKKEIKSSVITSRMCPCARVNAQVFR